MRSILFFILINAACLISGININASAQIITWEATDGPPGGSLSAISTETTGEIIAGTHSW